MIIVPQKHMGGQVKAPPSKSMAHRAVICAALASGTSKITNIEISEDIQATINAVRALGAQVNIKGEGRIKCMEVSGIKDAPEEAIIDCNESGSTLRFMIPVALAVGSSAEFLGSGRLPERPLGAYEKIFKQIGIKWHRGELNLPLKANGRLTCGKYDVPGDVSSQYITGLLLALPLLEGDSQIDILGNFESKQYVDLTIEMLNLFGIIVNRTVSGFNIPGGQSYKSADYEVEGDWSQAAFLSLMGALGKEVRISGLKKDSLQGDKTVIDILSEMGADVSWQNNECVVYGSQLSSCEVDVSQCPDLTPAIAAAMSVAKGKSRIYGGERLKIKETDRIATVAENLNILGASVIPTSDGMTIEGVPALSGGNADARGDHRLAMMVASVSSMCENEINLMGENSVNKSYPSFWEDFVHLGGKIK